MCGKSQRLLGNLRGDPVHLIENTAWLDDCDPVLRVALSLSHSGFRRLLRNRFIGENTSPDLPASLDESRDGDPGRFNLSASDPTGLERFKPEFSERDGSSAICLAAHPSLLHFSKFDLFRR